MTRINGKTLDQRVEDMRDEILAPTTTQGALSEIIVEYLRVCYQEVERLQEDTALLELVTRERDELRAVVEEIDGGDNPDLWGELVAERDMLQAEVKALKEAARVRGGCRWLSEWM